MRQETAPILSRMTRHCSFARKKASAVRTRPRSLCSMSGPRSSSCSGRNQDSKLKSFSTNCWRDILEEFDDSTRRTFERPASRAGEPSTDLTSPLSSHRITTQDASPQSRLTSVNSPESRIAGANFLNPPPLPGGFPFFPPQTKAFFLGLLGPYSNVESVSLCFPNPLKALSEGIQNAFLGVGGVPTQHRMSSSARRSRNSLRPNHADRSLCRVDGSLWLCCSEDERSPPNENGDVESQTGTSRIESIRRCYFAVPRLLQVVTSYMTFVARRIVTSNQTPLAGQRGVLTEERTSCQESSESRLDNGTDSTDRYRVSKQLHDSCSREHLSVPSRLDRLQGRCTNSAETSTVTHSRGHGFKQWGTCWQAKAASINYRHAD